MLTDRVDQRPDRFALDVEVAGIDVATGRLGARALPRTDQRHAERQKTGEPVHTWSPVETVASKDWRYGYKTVGQYMTRDLYTVHPDDLVDLAAHQMSTKRVRHIPVEDDTGRCVGLVSHRTLIRLLAQGAFGKADPRVAVSSIMTVDPVTVAPETLDIGSDRGHARQPGRVLAGAQRRQARRHPHRARSHRGVRPAARKPSPGVPGTVSGPAAPPDGRTFARTLGSFSTGRPGPTLLVCGGLHGNEPAGPRAALRVLADLKKHAPQLRGEFIAVEADEATYNMHVMLRFEIERAVFNGELAAKDIPGIWNEKVKSYLGLDVPNDSKGCLQDVHWSFGLLGYFPTYTLGNLHAAQQFESIREAIPSIDDQMARGEFASVLTWTRENIHAKGRQFRSNELCEQITGKALSADPLMRYLEGKLSGVYGV